MKKFWHWLTFPYRLNQELQRARELWVFYEGAYYVTRRSLMARSNECNALRRELEERKRKCRRCQ